MKVTVAKHNKDRYVVIEEDGKTVTYKAKMIMKTSETCYTDTEDYEYTSEVFEATFLMEEVSEMTNCKKEKTGHCKDCKWWKDNDGVYRRGIGAESKCPINCKKVYEGNGYCFMFEPQESEDTDGKSD